MTFDLTQRVRQLQRETGSVDPRELADKLITTLTRDEMREALAMTLASYVRDVLRTDRNAVMASPPPVTAPSSPPRTSARSAAVRSWYERLLDTAIDTSGGKGTGWKALGDCTAADLRSAADYKRELARRNAATADAYETLAGHLTGTQTVRELTADTVAAVLG